MMRARIGTRSGSTVTGQAFLGMGRHRDIPCRGVNRARIFNAGENKRQDRVEADMSLIQKALAAKAACGLSATGVKFEKCKVEDKRHYGPERPRPSQSREGLQRHQRGTARSA
ncbi:hypothetical protein CHELA1G2_14721 [Hyphomicrobiales bacterium]|nr:hypothetical protein CHELA1G2_14721 [Hyphomicrobiales bacterium]